MTFFHDSRLCLQKTEHFVKKSQNILGDKSLTATKLHSRHFSKKKIMNINALKVVLNYQDLISKNNHKNSLKLSQKCFSSVLV